MRAYRMCCIGSMSKVFGKSRKVLGRAIRADANQHKRVSASAASHLTRLRIGSSRFVDNNQGLAHVCRRHREGNPLWLVVLAAGLCTALDLAAARACGENPFHPKPGPTLPISRTWSLRKALPQNRLLTRSYDE